MFTDRHGFTTSELFSSSATSNSSSTRSLQDQLADACDDGDDDDDDNEELSSGDEYCILEQDDEVKIRLFPPKMHIAYYNLVLFQNSHKIVKISHKLISKCQSQSNRPVYFSKKKFG